MKLLKVFQKMPSMTISVSFRGAIMLSMQLDNISIVMHDQNDNYHTVRMLTPSALKLYGFRSHYILANVLMLLSYTNVCYLNYRN